MMALIGAPRGTVGFEEHGDTLQPLIERIEGVGAVTTELQYLPAVDIDLPDVVAAPISIWKVASPPDCRRRPPMSS